MLTRSPTMPLAPKSAERILSRLALAAFVALAVLPGGRSAPGSPPVPFVPVPTIAGLDFIDTSFENASPVWYEKGPDDTVLVYLLYDHERESPNRATGHIHILLHAKPGQRLMLEFKNLENVWNGRPSFPARTMRSVVISEDGRIWRSVPLERLPENRIRLTVDMPGPRLYVARVEPYRISDLDAFVASIRQDPLVQVAPIGHTVQGRELEMIRVGNPQAPYRVFLRARAHAWEPGGNWVVEGLVRRLLEGDADARRFLERYCVYLMPMANKDGVAMGRTRFNLLGRDLNRNWDKPSDVRHVPENVALEEWLTGMIAAGRKPHLAIDLHNDGGGRLHIARPPVPWLPQYLERMALLETLLRKHTWFTEGATDGGFRNSGSLGDGWLERFQVDALTHELNAGWIAGLNEPPLARHWRDYGTALATVFYEYFGAAPVSGAAVSPQ